MSKVVAVSDALHRQLITFTEVYFAEATALGEEDIESIWNEFGEALLSAQEGVLLPLDEAGALVDCHDDWAVDYNKAAQNAIERIRAAQAATAGGETASE